MKKATGRRSLFEMKTNTDTPRQTALGGRTIGVTASPVVACDQSSIITNNHVARRAGGLQSGRCDAEVRQVDAWLRRITGTDHGNAAPNPAAKDVSNRWSEETNSDCLKEAAERLKLEVERAFYECRDDDAEAAHEDLVAVEWRLRQANRRRT